jgi:hypothetical protein
MPASQAGRRRFDPGRPLHSFACKSEQLTASRENTDDRAASLSPTYHPNSTDEDWLKHDSLSQRPCARPRGRGEHNRHRDTRERNLAFVRGSGKRRASSLIEGKLSNASCTQIRKCCRFLEILDHGVPRIPLFRATGQDSRGRRHIRKRPRVRGNRKTAC